MGRANRLLGERTFHLRQGSDGIGWVAVDVWAAQDAGRIRVFTQTEGKIGLLREANPEVSELFELLDIEELLSNGFLMREVLSGREPVKVGSVGASIVAAAQAALSDLRGKVDALAGDAVSGLRGSLDFDHGLKDGWDAALTARIRQEAGHALTTAVMEAVIQAWADGRMRALMPILEIEEPYVAMPPERSDWGVGTEVLSAMRDVGLTVTEVLPRTGTSYQDDVVLRIASANGSHDIEVACRKGQPLPAVLWANRIHSAYRGPGRDMDEALALVRQDFAFFEHEATEEEVVVAAEKILAFHRERRAMLVGLIGEDGLATVLAVPPRDLDVTEPAYPRGR